MIQFITCVVFKNNILLLYVADTMYIIILLQPIMSKQFLILHLKVIGAKD